MDNKIRFSKVRKVKTPVRAHPTDAGIDFFIPEDTSIPILLSPGQSVNIMGGIKVEVPKGHALIFFNKSGIASKKSLVLGSCVVDEGYQGELVYNIHNIGTDAQTLRPGDKIVQGIVLPVSYAVPEEVPEAELYAEESSRGEGGFGSTGGN